MIFRKRFKFKRKQRNKGSSSKVHVQNEAKSAQGMGELRRKILRKRKRL